MSPITPRARLSALAPLAAALLLALPGSAADERGAGLPVAKGQDASLDPSYQMTSHKVVLIKEGELSPRVVTLEEGQLVAWISYAPVPSTVVFEREVARSMICHSLVNFSLQNQELRSAPIHAGEFASFCQLKPGRYRYKVVRSGASQLDGEIIVGNPGG